MATHFSTAFATGSVADVALGWLLHDPRPRLMLDSALRVRWCNERAEEELERHSGVSIRDGCLSFARPAAQRAFQEFVGALSADMHTIAIPGGESGMLLFRGWGLAMGRERVACVEFARDEPGFTGQYHDVDRVFGLTPAEGRVVRSLLDGRTAARIAQDLGVSVGTVRTHVRRVYSKIAVRSREELLSRLRPYCLT